MRFSQPFLPTLSLLVLLSGCYHPLDLSTPSIAGSGPSSVVDDEVLDGANYSDPVDWSEVPSPQIAEGVVLADDHPCIDRVLPFVDGGFDELRLILTCDVRIAPGDILVGRAHGGYLREVVDVQFGADLVTIETRQAQLADVFIGGGFHEQISFDSQARNALNFDGKELYDGQIGGADLKLLIERGMVRVRPELTLGAEFGFLSLENADAILTVDMDADLELLATLSNGLEHGDSVTLGEVNYPFAFAAGPVPVAGVLRLKLKAGYLVEAEASASASIGVELDPYVHVGLKYRDGRWYTVEENDFDHELIGPEFELKGDLGAKVTLSVEAGVMLYGAAGPSFFAGPYLRAEAGAECYDLSWSAHVGAEVGAAINLDVFVFDLYESWSFSIAEAELGSGSYQLATPLGTDCGAPPGCRPFEELSCGDIAFGDTSDAEFATTELDGYDIAVGNYAAPELAYSFVANQSGWVEVRFVDAQPTALNHDIFILDGGNGQCVSSEAFAWGLNSVAFEANAGHTYFLVVDGYDQDEGDFLLEVDCSL